MTASVFREARPLCAARRLSGRVAHVVLGGAAGLVWLVLPVMTINSGTAVALPETRPVTAIAAQRHDETSPGYLALPLVAVGTAGVLAGYAYVRRTRRARTRTTPGGGHAPPSAPWRSPPASDELDRLSTELITQADDWVRTSREELGFAEARFGAAAVEPFARAVREADAELAAACRMRERYDHGVPEDAAARMQALAGVVGRCEEAGRLLDAEAASFDELRGLERGSREALEVAEARFRELAGRTGAAASTVAGLRERYGPAAVASVTGHVELAKDRLLLATSRLNRAHQSADAGDAAAAARHLRVAEGAVAQIGVFVHGVERLAEELSTAGRLVPAALSGAEADVEAIRRAAESATAQLTAGSPGTPGPAGAGAAAPAPVPGASSAAVPVDVAAGELRARVTHADLELAHVRVRAQPAAGPYDPLDALRRIVRATAPVGTRRSGVLSAAEELVARSALAAADDFAGTHRGVVGATVRIRLAEARRLLPTDPQTADALARQARELAEQDVRLHGNPSAAGDPSAGATAAVLGGILLGEDPDGGPPACYGGPGTRARRRPKPA
ncbi:hypothetical protein [Streptomyces sp. CB01373]|uniref:hypothetical protein n=1 Tax=Streptomyces sp. CB01373 TaxID=2020325 RepID=UPI000C278E90|nr:hypothetical protein [Streptomyces sp. CB01373]PJM96097.1 hypothetical protein CG719_10370 [Streptomyces sp. CB01373]